MARRAFAASFVLGSLALVAGQTVMTQGCTQDFGTFDTSGGADPSGPASSGSQASSGAGTPTSSSSSKSSTGPGGGEGGGDGGAGPTTTTTTTTTTGTGGGEPCEPGDLCDDGELCTTDACVDGFCVNDPLAAGTTEPGYTDDPEDCVIRECDGAGNAAEVADADDDPPEDAEACAERVCDGINIADGDPIREGDPCGPDPLVCTDGVCVGCDDAADCPTPPGACEVALCDDDGACGSEIVDDDPVDGDDEDCRTPTCDGVDANITFVADAAQTPADKPCGTGMCTGMTPGFDPVGDGNACNGGGGVCDGDDDDDACVECVDDAAFPTADAGCTAPTSVCDDSGTPACVRCLPTGGPPNDGCAAGALVCDPDLNAGDGGCVDCYNAGGMAIGCTNPANDQCKEAAGAGTCFDVCYNVDPGADPGCADVNLPNCNEGGQACQECTAAGDCAANMNGNLCNQTGNTECGCSGGADAASCTIGANGSSQGTRCVSGACGCTAATDCDHVGAAGTTCNMTTNVCE